MSDMAAMFDMLLLRRAVVPLITIEQSQSQSCRERPNSRTYPNHMPEHLPVANGNVGSGQNACRLGLWRDCKSSCSCFSHA
eukprot:365889-Chlamydomonas_euryale.AAC.12